MPKASKTFDETSCTEWFRIREVETERAMMDCHGLFYEIGFHLYADQLWAIRPVCSHLRIIPDYCSWKGMLVMGGNQATPMKFGPADGNPLAGQPQAGLWFGKRTIYGHGVNQPEKVVFGPMTMSLQECLQILI